MNWSILALSMHFFCLFILNFLLLVESHNYSPLVTPRHFDERLTRETPPATIKVVTKNGTKKLIQIQEGGKNMWRWVMDGARSPAPQAMAQAQAQARPAAAAQPQARPAAAAAQPAGPIFLFDPPTKREQEEIQDALVVQLGKKFRKRVPKDVYEEYRRLLKELGENKKIIPSRTIPAKVVSIQQTTDNLYRAVSYALTGTEMLYNAVRMAVLEYFESFFGQWDKRQAQAWMGDYEVRSLRRQADKIKSGKAGGTVELIAAAKKINMNVLVYKTDADLWLCISPSTLHRSELVGKNCQVKDTMTIALEWYDSENYDVIMDVKQK